MFRPSQVYAPGYVLPPHLRPLLPGQSHPDEPDDENENWIDPTPEATAESDASSASSNKTHAPDEMVETDTDTETSSVDNSVSYDDFVPYFGDNITHFGACIVQ